MMEDSDENDLSLKGFASSSNSKSSNSTELELAQIDKEVAEINRQIQKLEGRKRILKRKAELLREKMQKEESDALLGQDWETRRFAWSERLEVARTEVFGLSSYRPDQLAVINATMSGHDCLLVMPTGKKEGKGRWRCELVILLRWRQESDLPAACSGQ